MAWDFTGALTDKVDLTPSNSVNHFPNSDWTQSIWAKHSSGSITSGTYQNIWSGDGSGGTDEFAIRVNTSEQIYALYSDNFTGDINTAESGNSFNNTNWHHILARRSGTTFSLRVDDTEVISGTLNDAITIDDAVGFGDISWNAFDGYIAEAGKWDRALSDDECTALSNGFAPSCFPKDMVLYIPMIREYIDVVSGQTVTNSGTSAAEHPLMIYPTGGQVVSLSGSVTHNPTDALAISFDDNAPTLQATFNPVDALAISFTDNAPSISGGLVTQTATEDFTLSSTANIVKLVEQMASESFTLNSNTGLDGGFLPNYYADLDVSLEGIKHSNKVIDSTIIRKDIPEFLAGIEPFSTTSVDLSNIDKSFNSLRASHQFRGSILEIREHFFDDPAFETQVENNLLYTGVVESTTVDHDTVTLNATTQGLDILDTPFPTRVITTDLLPNAIDLDVAINEVYGEANKVPLPLILAQDTPSIVYEYLVGRGMLTVNTVYRDDLVISEFAGTAQSGTASTIQLASVTNENDDFFNDAYVEITGGTGAGQVRLISDYNGSTDTCTVSANWTTNPDNTSVYAIREWGKFTKSIDGETHTIIRFAITQRQGNAGQLFTRQNMTADVTGLSTETNPAEAVNTILTAIGANVNPASVTAAVTEINTIGNLTVGGAMVEQKSAREWLDELCIIGRIFLSLNEDFQYQMEIIGTQNVISGTFDDQQNIVTLSTPSEDSLFNLWKNFAISYRPFFSTNEFRLRTETKDVFPDDGRIEEVREFFLIEDKTTADKVADFIAKVKVGTDQPRIIGTGNRGRKIQNLEILNLELPPLDISNSLYMTIGSEISNGEYTFTIIPHLATIDSYTVGTLPSDPATDGQADFRFTPAQAVSSFAVNHSVVTLNVSAQAALSWTNPTNGNYTGAVIEYKKNSDSLYEVFTTTTAVDTNVTITGLDVGTNYDFRATSLNVEGDRGGVALITSSTTAGDTTAPSTPTGLTFSVKFRTFTAIITPNATSDNVKHYEWEIWETDGADSLLDTVIGGSELEFTASGTTSTGRKVRVRAIDFADNESAQTSFSSTLTTATLTGGGSGDIGSNTITDANVNDLNANTINAGILTVDGAPSAINVTGSGAINLSSGGDITMTATASDTNFITFKNSGGTTQGFLTWDVSPTGIILRATASGANMIVRSDLADTFVTADDGDLFLRADATTGLVQITGDIYRFVGGNSTIEIQGTVDDSIVPTTDSMYNLGSASLQWATVYRDAEGDVPMRNAFVITEADYVYKDMDRDDGIFIMVRTDHVKDKEWKWKPALFIDNQGNLHCNKVISEASWGKPDYNYDGNKELDLLKAFHKTNRGDN